MILRIYLVALIAILFSACGNTAKQQGTEKVAKNDNFELSYWVDIDLRNNNGRGYWKDVTAFAPDTLPTAAEVENASISFKENYYAEKLYVVYHRQFEIEDAKKVFENWNKSAARQGIEIVPTIVLENYETPSTMNFTDEEIAEFAAWSLKNINSAEFGIYDVYSRQQEDGKQNNQLVMLKEKTANKLVLVGLQPGITLSNNFMSAVQDTWTAECQGLTNELWENPVMFKGTDNYGRKLLEEWIKERADGENRRIVWDMIPVAWDYEAPVDSLGYICPGDDALINDPPIDGRIDLCHTYFVKNYPDGMLNPKFGGYSCDLHILEANSYGKPERPTFYDQLKANKPYKGYFASAMDQVASLYKSLR